MTLTDLIADLADEHATLDALVASLDDEQWFAHTPSVGWTIADQVAHLTYFDHAAALAITNPTGFPVLVETLLSFPDMEAADNAVLAPYRTMTPAELLAVWRDGREELLAAAATLGESDRVPWYGPSMGAKSFVTARLMETWAHGHDIADTVMATPEHTDRLSHIARLGVITRGWTYVSRGLETPEGDVRVELTAPSGAVWTYGPAEADEVVRGEAADFCLVVTQRRHLDDTDLETTPLARDWLIRAQAFAGPPTDGPAPQQD